MFIIEARSAKVELDEHERMRTVVRHVHGPEHRGLTESMLSAVERAASVEHGSLDADWLAPQPHSSVRRLLPEVFFGSSSMFVLAPAGKRLDAWEVRQQGRSSTLDGFCAAVTTALRESGVTTDGDDIPHWRPRTPQVRHPEAEFEPQTEATPSTIGPEQRAAAAALSNDDARGFVTELVRSGSSITDLDDSPMTHYSTLGDLHRHGLIEREYVVICRQDHRTLGRLGDLDDSARQSILQLSCPTCGRRFSEELLRQVHAPSRAAIELVRDGSWRPTWVLGLLEEHGFDLGQITRLAGAGGNGSALRVDSVHGRLLIELPEAEFGMQHAYGLIRRLQRQNVEFGLVLSTEPVSDDAYQYLSDRVAQSQGPMVSVLEGSEAIARELGEALNEWSIISVRMLAEELIDTIGVDVGTVIEAWMRRGDRARAERRASDEPTYRRGDGSGDREGDHQERPEGPTERSDRQEHPEGRPERSDRQDQRAPDGATITELPRASSGQSS